MKTSKNLWSILLVSLLAVLSPSSVFAHVKWFAEETEYIRPYSLNDNFVIISIISVCILIALGIYLERKLHVPEKLKSLVERTAPMALSAASIGFGLAFIIFSIKGFIFAPNLPAENSIGLLMIIIQGLAGLMMFFGLYERIGGMLIVLLFALGISQYGYIEMLDTLEMLGFAFYVMIVGRPLWKIRETNLFSQLMHKIHAYGYPILRVGTGLNLIILGFTEKILNPSLTNNFLETHSWNFMTGLGMSDYWFAYSAGMAEITFGLFFLLGLVTRTTTILLAVFLVTTLYLLGPIELIGHLPHFSIAIALFVLGSGSRFVLLKNKE